MSGIKFGLAFCEASGKCLVRWSGTGPVMIELARKNAAAIGAGHSFILFLGDGFFPSVGAQVDTMPLFDVERRAAAEAGRDPAHIEMIADCPDLLPSSTIEPKAAIEERARRGISRIVLPVGPFMPNLEESLARFGDRVIRPFADA